MKQHKFTIIVPTRERADTLYWCLKTLVAQDYENLEILVSDNFSQDNTKEVVDAFNDKRIRYINTGKRVEMSVNWEFALSHVTDVETYVGFLGDDDGYMPHTITYLNDLLNSSLHTDGLVWKMSAFQWKGSTVEGVQPTLHVPITTNTIELRDAATWYKKYQTGLLSMQDLLCTYSCGLVSNRVVTEIRNLYDGKVIRSSMPDLFLATILTKYANNYLYINSVLSVGGSSKKANSSTQDSTFKQLFRAEMQQFPPIHPALGKQIVVSWVVLNAEAVLYAETDKTGKVNDKMLDKMLNMIINAILTEIRYCPREKYLHIIEQINQMLLPYPEKKAKWQKNIMRYPNLHQESHVQQTYGMVSSSMTFNVSETSLDSIADATSFVYFLLHGTYDKIDILEKIRKKENNVFSEVLKKMHYYTGRLMEKSYKHLKNEVS